MKVIVDSSIWIDHLRHPNHELIQYLQDDLVLTHSGIIGELACGSIRERRQFLGNLRLLPRALEASFDEALQWIETKKLHGLGLSWVDVQLLASAALSEARIYTRDKRLDEAQRKLRG